MHQAQAIIERVRRVSAGIQRLELAVDKAHRTLGGGQFFLARAAAAYDPYLREAWLPVEQRGAVIVVERPSRHVYMPNQVVDLLGPISKPFPLRETTRTLLLITYEATPAIFLLLMHTALARGAAVALVLIGQAGHYPLDALPQAVEVTRAADHTAWVERGQQIIWADQIFAAAPPPYDTPSYLRLLDEVRVVRQLPAPEYVYGVFQPPMPCGIGACQACLVRVQGGADVPACTEGMAFDLLSVNLLQNLPSSTEG